MQLQKVVQELRRQIALRDENIPIPLDKDISRLVEEGYIRNKPYYFPADVGDFIQAWLKYLEDHRGLTIAERFMQWFKRRLRR